MGTSKPAVFLKWVPLVQCHTVKVFHSKNIGFGTIFTHYFIFLGLTKITTHNYLLQFLNTMTCGEKIYLECEVTLSQIMITSLHPWPLPQHAGARS